jgi:hypothetical protein
MSSDNVHGPIDFLLLEFPGDRLTGAAGRELLALIDQGIVRLYDLLVIAKGADGQVEALELNDAGIEIEGFSDLAGARSGLLGEEDIAEAAAALEPGTVAALVVYENTWAIPFVAAARESGGEVVASARIPAQDIMDALDTLEALEGQGATT